MTNAFFRKRLFRLLGSLASIYCLVLCLAGCLQRKLLFYPGHETSSAYAQVYGLSEWKEGGEIIGYSRVHPHPRRIWLMFHGNAGQASQRGYVLPLLKADDALFILEYPGYGSRSGHPSRSTFNTAAEQAYRSLVQAYPRLPICILGESIGSGAACYVAALEPSPSRVVLAVPFDRLQDVAQEKLPYLPIGLLMLDRWNNLETLSKYHGRIDILGALHDQVIPVHHARTLAKQVPWAQYHELPCGHNAWANANLDGVFD